MTIENDSTQIDLVELQESLEDVLFSYQALFNILKLSEQSAPIFFDVLTLMQPINDKFRKVLVVFE